MKKLLITLFALVLFASFSIHPSDASAVSNASATKELKAIKKATKSGQTPRSKGVKVKGTYASMVKKHGKKYKTQTGYMDEVNEFVYANGLTFENGRKQSSKTGMWIVDKKSKFTGISDRFKNKTLTYKQIKAVFGSKTTLDFSQRTGNVSIGYKVGKHTVYFETEKYKTNYSNIPKLSNNLKFKTYFVR